MNKERLFMTQLGLLEAELNFKNEKEIQQFVIDVLTLNTLLLDFVGESDFDISTLSCLLTTEAGEHLNSKDLLNNIYDLIDTLDSYDEDDTFGTEGWLHYVGWD